MLQTHTIALNNKRPPHIPSRRSPELIHNEATLDWYANEVAQGPGSHNPTPPPMAITNGQNTTLS